MTEREKIIDYAISQIGTPEDPLGSNKQKYGAMLDSTDWYLYKEGERIWRHLVNGYDWCSQFVDASFITTLGIDRAREILNRPVYNNYGAVVKYSYNYLKSINRAWPKSQHSPEAGDIIYFQNSAGLSHVGIITSVSGNMIQTVEGNSGKNCWYVAQHSYNKNTSTYIYGYGAPLYNAKPEPDYIRDGVYTVTCKGPLRLRMGASVKDEILLDLAKGDKVHCLKVTKKDGRTWLRVDGWCCAEENGIKYIE